MVAEWSRAPAERKADFLATSPALVAGAAQLDERFGEDLPAAMRAFIANRSPPTPPPRRRALAAAPHPGRDRRRPHRRAGARRPCRLAMARRRRAETIADTQRARAEAALTAADQDRRYADLRSRPGPPQSHRHAGRSRAAHPRTGAEPAAPARAGWRSHARPAPARGRGARRACSIYLDQGDGNGARRVRARARHPAGDDRGDAEVSRSGAIWRSPGTRSATRIALGDARGALEAFKAALALISTLAEGNPRDQLSARLSLSLNKVADALAFLGQREEALTNYRKSITIVETLAASDPQASAMAVRSCLHADPDRHAAGFRRPAR